MTNDGSRSLALVDWVCGVSRIIQIPRSTMTETSDLPFAFFVHEFSLFSYREKKHVCVESVHV